MQIKTKSEMKSLLNQGRFGNMLQSWNSLDDFLASSYSGQVTMRYSGSGGGAWCEYNVPRSHVEERVNKWISEGADRSRIYFNMSAPDDLLLIQGEVMRCEWGLYLCYSTLKKPMRIALTEKCSHSYFLSAQLTLKHFLDAASYENIINLLDEYPDCVIEFSTFDSPVGNLGWNTIVWEVRHY